MARLTTLYNGACPVCRREIAHYKRLTACGKNELTWCDISKQPAAIAAWGLDGEAVKRRLHVVDRDGRLRIGVPAFAALWSEIPRYRWLAAVVGWPGLRQLAAGIYELLAAWLYARNRRREAKARDTAV